MTGVSMSSKHLCNQFQTKGFSNEYFYNQKPIIKISSEFSRMKSSKSLEDKLMNLGNMISLLSKQNEELADQMNKSLK